MRVFARPRLELTQYGALVCSSKYALEDIPAGTELTMRYDSMNWRDAMQEVKQAVGELKGAHNQAT